MFSRSRTASSGALISASSASLMQWQARRDQRSCRRLQPAAHAGLVVAGRRRRTACDYRPTALILRPLTGSGRQERSERSQWYEATARQPRRGSSAVSAATCDPVHRVLAGMWMRYTVLTKCASERFGMAKNDYADPVFLAPYHVCAIRNCIAIEECVLEGIRRDQVALHAALSMPAHSDVTEARHIWKIVLHLAGK